MKKSKQIKLIGWLFLSMLLASNVNAAQWQNPDLLVDAKTLHKYINNADWIVIDCRDLKSYLKGHIPNAISFGKRCKKVLRDTTSRVFRDTSKYESLFGKMGIGNDNHVVYYYEGLKTLTDATVGFWVSEYLGLKNVHVLNGGLTAWRKAGFRLDNKPTIRPKTTFTAKIKHNRYGATDEIIKFASGKSKNFQLIDSRTKNEYTGIDIRSIRGGFVPRTTLNVSHIDTLATNKDPKTGKQKTIPYLDPDKAIKAFGKLDKNQRTLAYCQTGTRSTLTYLQLRLLGFSDVANWDESWQVYGSNLSYPVAGEQWFNFAGLNKKLKWLEKKIATLEKAKK